MSNINILFDNVDIQIPESENIHVTSQFMSRDDSEALLGIPPLPVTPLVY